MNAQVWVQALTLGSTIAVLGWALTAGPLRIFSRASREFMGFNTLVLLGALSWLSWPLVSRLPQAYGLALGLLGMLAGVQWLCGGMHKLQSTQGSYVVSPFMLPVLASLMAVVAWLDTSGQSLALASFSACVWMLGVSVQQVFPSLMAQAGRKAARWVLLPFALAATLWLLGMCRSAWMLVQGGGPDGAPSAALSALQDEWQLVVWLISWGLLNGGLVGMLFLKFIEKIRELSTEDELTGALNVRSFMALLNDERERLRRTPQPQSVLTCEIDQLAALNKQLGFPAGDAALRHATHVIGRHLRKTDRLARTLNGELILFLPATPAVGATLVAERTQTVIKTHPLLWNGQSVALSLSMGVSSRDTPAMDCETLLELSRRGVERARREGGARVRVARFDGATQDLSISPPGASPGAPVPSASGQGDRGV